MLLDQIRECEYGVGGVIVAGITGTTREDLPYLHQVKHNEYGE